MTDSPDDPFDLDRFVTAQEDIYPTVLSELRAGDKRSHWMWYVFPQLDGLGTSSTAKHYAIRNLDEARAYLAHALLGPRLLECCSTLLGVEGRTASEIFGFPDDLKLRSSMTLFAEVSEADSVFVQVLDKYYQSKRDTRTLELLQADTSES